MHPTAQDGLTLAAARHLQGHLGGEDAVQDAACQAQRHLRSAARGGREEQAGGRAPLLMACAPVQLAHTTDPECCAQHRLRWNGLLHGSWPPGRSEGRCKNGEVTTLWPAPV